MSTLDAKWNLTTEQVGIIKHQIKRSQLLLNSLPVLPELVEEILFLQGRDSWIYSWDVIENPRYPLKSIEVILTVKLKKDFHKFSERTKFKFQCNVKISNDLFKPSITLKPIFE